jgi:hypothetical protein
VKQLDLITHEREAFLMRQFALSIAVTFAALTTGPHSAWSQSQTAATTQLIAVADEVEPIPNDVFGPFSTNQFPHLFLLGKVTGPPCGGPPCQVQVKIIYKAGPNTRTTAAVCTFTDFPSNPGSCTDVFGGRVLGPTFFVQVIGATTSGLALTLRAYLTQ